MSEKNLSLLESEILSLPCISDEKNFNDYLKKRIEAFQKHIQLFDGQVGEHIAKNRNKIDILSQSVVEAIEISYEGLPSKAFNKFKEGLDICTDHLAKQKRDFSIGNKNLNFYRARIETTPIPTDEMFHIRFENRHLIKTKRYSIPGLPCLYLSDSIYTCWVELGMPKLETFQVSRLDLDYRFLNISITQEMLTILYKATVEKEMKEDSFNDWVLDFLIKWPLSMACYVKAEHNVADFKPEYVIPQMLMEWIRLTEDLDGIKYFSTRSYFEIEKCSLGRFNNYAIPIKKVMNQGLCPQLVYDIKITEPLTWNSTISAYPEIKEKIFEKSEMIERMHYDPSIVFLHEKGQKHERYINTHFAKMEYALQKMEAKRIVQ